MSRILPTPLVFISGYANTENVFYCLNLTSKSSTTRKFDNIHFTNVAMHLFSYRSQMMSKYGKNKKSGTWAIRWECYWCSYHILTSSVIYCWTDARQHLFVVYNNTTRHGSSGGYLMHNCISITSSFRETYFIWIANTWNALPNNIKGITTLRMLKVNFLFSKKESLLRLSF